MQRWAPSKEGSLFSSEHISLQDVAEAAGVSEEAARVHLRQIRAEKAFDAPHSKREFPTLWVLAATAFGVAVVVTALRIRAFGGSNLDFHPGQRAVPVPRVLPGATAQTVITRPLPPVNSIATFSYPMGPDSPPSGINVYVIGQRTSVTGQGPYTGRVAPMPYQVELDGIVRSVVALAEKSVELDSKSPMPIRGAVRDFDGNTVTPTPGKVHYSFSGWPGHAQGWLAMPLTAEGREQVRQDAAKFLEKFKKEQDAAIDTSVNVHEGIVSPPPGFSIEFNGRRTDTQAGPHIYFVPIAEVAVRRRLLLAMENAMWRDGRPPIGRWDEDAAREAKIPKPDQSRVTIEGPNGSETFDVPSGDGWTRDSARVVEEHIEKLLKESKSSFSVKIQSDGPAPK
jgi:hypothetical protein